MKLIRDKDQTTWLIWHLMSKCHIARKSNSCWEWRGKYSGGYGYYSYLGKKHLVHRLMYQLWYGDIAKGMVIRHMCHNPQCCYPEHLQVGTQQQNMDDMRKAGRQANNSKLTTQHRRQIRKSTLTLKQLADIYKVSVTTIWRVKNHHK